MILKSDQLEVLFSVDDASILFMGPGPFEENFTSNGLVVSVSNSNPLGIFYSNGQQNTSRVGARGIIVVALAMSINSHEQTQ